jgi:signal transduction histidine kinase
VRVRDTGPGIDAEQQKEIFERYAQARHGARRYGSSGLGLALCKELVTLHGGRIWVESEPGRGATFRFTLPRYREPEH